MHLKSFFKPEDKAWFNFELKIKCTKEVNGLFPGSVAYKYRVLLKRLKNVLFPSSELLRATVVEG